MPDLSIENTYQNCIVVGIDEVGRGSLVGPVVAAAVMIINDKIEAIDDSKKLKASTREILYSQIMSNHIAAYAIVWHEEIDKINILEATKKACIEAANAITCKPDVILIDGNMRFNDPRFVSIVNGDNLSISIAAASIVAKVTRDNLMRKLDIEFPQYGWSKNFGYGTKYHIEAIKKYGLSKYHRKSFKITALTSSNN